MVLLPTQLLVSAGLGFASLLALCFALVLLGGPFLKQFRKRALVSGPVTVEGAPTLRRRSVAQRVTLILALLLVLLAFGGRYIAAMLVPAGDRPADDRVITSRLNGGSGARLAIESIGPADAPVIVFTHGWGADGREWSYFRPLADRYRLMIWDLPGLGESGPIPDGYTMEKMASDLRSVVNAAGDRPVLLVGHSVGGMLNLTYARMYPEEFRKRVKGIVQLNTTYTNPLRTTKDAERHLALQRPVYEPLLHAVQFTSPVVRGLGWLSYMSGLAHLQLAVQSFAGTETWGELDFAARYAYRSSPGIVASGVLAMLDWDATQVLPQIAVPTLIVTGNQDTTTLPVASLVMKREMKQATLIAIDRAAHLGPIEQHEHYVAAVRAFADRAAPTDSIAATSVR